VWEFLRHPFNAEEIGAKLDTYVLLKLDCEPVTLVQRLAFAHRRLLEVARRHSSPDVVTARTLAAGRASYRVQDRPRYDSIAREARLKPKIRKVLGAHCRASTKAWRK